MRIRFLQAVPSDAPAYPFQVGQVITVDKPTAEMRGWLKNGYAEIVKDETELATVGASDERAVPAKGKSR